MILRISYKKKGGESVKKEKVNEGINVFQKFLTIWVIICMIVGVFVGKYLP